MIVKTDGSFAALIMTSVYCVSAPLGNLRRMLGDALGDVKCRQNAEVTPQFPRWLVPVFTCHGVAHCAVVPWSWSRVTVLPTVQWSPVSCHAVDS